MSYTPVLATPPPNGRRQRTPGSGKPGTAGSSRQIWRQWFLSTLVVAVVTFGFGLLTPFAQEYLPSSIGTVTNTAGGWTVVVFLVVLLTKNPPLRSILLATLGYLLLNSGYSLSSNLRGSFYAGDFWNVVAFVAGPAVGLATAWIRSANLRLAAIGAGIISAIFIGEGAYGLAYVAGYTGWFYWAGELVVGVVILIAIAASRLRSPLYVISALITAAVGAVGFVYAYSSLGEFG
ncbi:MAG: hypothetical protein JWQ43_3794 [Glaciihabitans sp.]|nr:hypothetical protein [Glaciihabitans sp.]